MPKRYGAQTVELIPGRKIILTSAIGKTNLDELKWLCETVLEEAKPWETTGWAYIADYSQMPPVFQSESMALIDMTKKLAAAGCKALAFVEGKAFMIRIQAHNHTVRAQTGAAEGHFQSIQEALDWIAEEVQC